MENDASKASADRGAIANILRSPLTSLVTAMGHLGSWGFVAVAFIIAH